ncbi:glutathione degradosome [Canariomyces notabilis]|uniref:Glutathione degradosome n=1 Tax=Canariomyces notabilis TaxID=2074819 RepID=A0AAN6YRW0_9PEZI|nr:glutathione degradosome [Canariomyces arenarius]
MATLQPRNLEDGCSETAPEQLQELRHDGSVLAIAVSDRYIFAGTSKGEIVVWSLGTYQLVQTIQAHKRSVLCLLLSDDDKYLFSSACEPIIGVWCPKSFGRLYEIYSTYDVGDVFSVAYSVQRETLYLGTQTQDIQWVGLKDPARRVSHDSANHPDKRQHRFFDSRAIGGTSTPRRTEEHYALIPKASTVLEIDPGAIRQYAHYGWVFCMQIAKGPTVLGGPDEEFLVSGGGDGTIKLWRLADHGPDYDGDERVTGDIEEMMVLGDDNSESVMSLAIDGSFLYAGKLQGIIELWDLDTKQKLRVIKAHDGAVNSLNMSFGLLWSAGTGGSASKHSTVHYGRDKSGLTEDVSQKYQCLSRWKAHDAKVLSTAVGVCRDDQLFITGANDNTVRVWRVNGMPTQAEQGNGVVEGMMTASLREFVSYKTVSSRPEFTEDCRKGATFLGSLFRRLGAQVEMLSTGGLHNPIVFAKFSGKLEPPEKRKRILFYGHYDVVPADMKGDNWQTDPFQLTGRDGYLYGRGVTDNKGPIIAALYAVSDLLQAKVLDSDIIFVIEGEEESGSRGFQDTIRRNKELIGHIDYVLLANSYWLDDQVPCLTYGLRGVLHATICIDSKLPDLHSGVDGSNLIAEPLSELTLLLSKLKDSKNRVQIPGFYDGILPMTEEEGLRYDDIARILIRRNPANGPIDALKRSLMARWREPNLTIHRYNVSGPDGSLISSHATANVSVRLVPGQEVDQVIASLEAFLRDEYARFGSENTLTIRIDNKAEPWLGVPGNYIFRTLEEAVMRAWGPTTGAEGDGHHDGGKGDAAAEGGVTLPANGTSDETAPKSRKPLYIREGGSIPPIRFLEKEFNAPAAHLPCGQASDAAHLVNERLRVLNLLKSREIFSTVFRKL